jgi:hypothetical protein
MLPREFINYQDKLYWIYRKVKQSQVKEGSITELRDFWMCDIVIKSRNNQDETLLFMRECSDAIIVKDLF